MPEAPKTFSESWYRIAAEHVALRPQVQVRRQFFRGRRWYVLRDPFNNQFFRLHPFAYLFVARLRRDRTVQQVWEECLELYPDEGPGQQEVIQLLGQLFAANLIQCDRPADTAKLFERYRQRRRRELQSRLSNIMFARFPLFDPENLLRRAMPLVGPWISSVGACLWVGVVLAAVKVGVDHAPAFVDQGQAILAPTNLFLLYLGLVLIKTLHEFGHAFVCRKLGGEVHEMGIMLLLFTPLPYMDATSAWTFRSRWHRALTGAAGMLTEVFAAACLMFVWAATGPGTLHSLAYNMMFVASVSTVLFNGNPLLRFDGYYILSDLLDIPNLHGQAARQLVYLVERYLFGSPAAEAPAATRREAAWLTVFGVLSRIYRVIVFAGILLFVASKFLLAGLVMALVCTVSWVLMPLLRLCKYLASSPRLARVRPRAVAVSLLLATALVALLQLTPVPVYIKAPGILEAEHAAWVTNASSGFVREVLAAAAAPVRTGQPLFRLADPELAFEIAVTQAETDRARVMQRQALDGNMVNLQPIAAHLRAVETRLARLQEQERQLTVRAPRAGFWAVTGLEQLHGAWLPRGTGVGQVLDRSSYVFKSIVSQNDARQLFAEPFRGLEVRLIGQARESIPVSAYQVLPADQVVLPSAALGWLAGGDVAVDMTDPSGRRTTEPFFEVRAMITASSPVTLLPGRSGRLRCEFAPKPLLTQWLRNLRQLIQKRYQL